MFEVVFFNELKSKYVNTPAEAVAYMYDPAVKFIWDDDNCDSLYTAPRFKLYSQTEFDILVEILKERTGREPITNQRYFEVFPQFTTYQLLNFIAHYPQYWDCYIDGGNFSE